MDLFATQFLGNNQTTLSAMLQGEPAGLGMTQFNSSIDRTLWNVAPTLDVTGKHGLDFRLGGSSLFSSHLHSGTVNVNVSQKMGQQPGEVSRRMNRANLMQQVKKMQAEMTKAQEELANTVVTGAAAGGTVTVEVTGDQRVRSVKIGKEAVDPEDIETLEDLIIVAVNDALTKSNEAAQQRMGDP